MAHRRSFALFLAAFLGLGSSRLLAAPALTGAFSSTYSLQNISTSADLLHIDQLAFNPADPTHLYVARVALSDAEFGSIVRFDYNVDSVTGATTISNPTTIATLESGWGPVGIAFWQGKMIVSLSKNIGGTDSVGDYGNDGRLAIFSPTAGGFNNRIDFAYGIHGSYHQINQLRIFGNTLYLGIGTRDNGGLSSSNASYNGTIARIADLSQTNFTDADNNGVTEVNALASDFTTLATDGMLRLYASGFRNPFGLHVTPGGNLWVTDNGRDDYNGDTITADLLYKELPAGATAIFPTGSGTVTPLADLGDETAATGLALLAYGPDIGDALVARYQNTGAQGGADFVLVDSVTGQVNVFANGFVHPIDAVVDPYGRILVADFGSFSTPGVGSLYLIAPEPASLATLALGSAFLFRRHGARC